MGESHSMTWTIIVDSVDRTRVLSEKKFYVNYRVLDDTSKDILQNTAPFSFGTAASDVQDFFNNQISSFKSGILEIDAIPVGTIATL